MMINFQTPDKLTPIASSRFQSNTNLEYFHPHTLNEELKIRKLKYFDSFTPSDQKIMNSPFKLLKH